VRCAVVNGGGATDFCARFLDENDAPVKNFTVNLGEAKNYAVGTQFCRFCPIHPDIASPHRVCDLRLLINRYIALSFNAGQNLPAECQTVSAFKKVIIFQLLARNFWIHFLHHFAILGIQQGFCDSAIKYL